MRIRSCLKGAALGAAFCAAISSFGSKAEAFCRTTTCELSETPEAPCQRDADGCAEDGFELAWEENCLTYAVQAEGSDALGIDADTLQLLIDAAFARWREVECPGGGAPDFEAVFQGFVGCREQQTLCGGASANVNVIMFQDKDWPYPPASAALTSTIAELESGVIVDADLELNSALHTFSHGGSEAEGALSLERVLTHEIGHFLGLSHSDDAAAVMNAYYQGQSGVELAPDDIAGICAVFPPTTVPRSCDSSEPAYDACASEDALPQTCDGAEDASPSGEPSNRPAESDGLSADDAAAESGCQWTRSRRHGEAPPAVLLLAGCAALARRRRAHC